MVHFRKKSAETSIELPNKLTKDEIQKYKLRTASVNDPILEAVQEAQPFEQMADTLQQDPSKFSYFKQLDGQMQLPTDIFGNIIKYPDMSNPTRNRDERPLDTIRGFQYALTGDPIWFHCCETGKLGFKIRPENWDSLFFTEVNAYDVPFHQMERNYSIETKKRKGFKGWFKR